MAFISESICSVCCETFSKDQTNLSHLLHFQKLYSSLNAVGGGTITAITSEKQLNSTSISEVEKLVAVICPECLVCVSSTLTQREQLDSLEVEVRQLQMKILGLLNNLQASVKAFKTEVNIMDGIVKLGRDNIRNLDNFYCSGTMEDGSKGQILLKDVIQFRKKVLTVCEDLCNFGNINLKAYASPDSTTTGHSAEFNSITPHGRSRNKQSQKKNPVQMEAPVGEEEEGDEQSGVDMDDNDFTHDFMEWCPEEESATGSLDVSAYPFNENSTVVQNSDIESNSAEDEDDDDNDDGYFPSASSPKSSKKYKERIPAPDNGTLPQKIDFSKMTTFKKNLITRIINRREKLQRGNKKKCKSKTQDKTPEELKIDELDPRNFCFINYDPKKTNTLSVRTINITIDEQEESLLCTKCDFKCYQSKVRRAFEFEETMYNHVVGRHLKLYTCPHCRRDRFLQFRTLRNHILSHDNRFACDICGKTLSCAASLRNHKWYHLNEEEKAEAVKNGAKPPEEAYMRVKERRQKKYQCPVCGKGFFYPCDLKRHETETHRSNRPHMCSQCGKTFRGREGLASHLKNVCYPGKGVEKRFRCHQCPKAYHVHSKLRMHKIIHHSSEPPTYKCSVCEKVFKTKDGLTAHKRSHSDTKPILCG